MKERSLVWFVSDVHLGLLTADPAERERRFVAFLKAIPRESSVPVGRYMGLLV